MIAPICILSCSVRNEPSVFKLARMIHEHFCCNRRSAALTRATQDRMCVFIVACEIRFTRNVLLAISRRTVMNNEAKLLNACQQGL